ncbi:MAG TPA: type II toxin-antitoxin system PemK/MazF family toxin [Bacteroidia bacterium]|jgi:mRNA interferase MazF|nr:type II toxin-antitoxin system PemK/MazF family toxin [Bacteroidia bacterium]
MSKEFDKWNIQKKNINAELEGRLYRKREIWWCVLGINVGFEQDGSGKNYQRPVIILRGFSKQVCLIVPLTTSTKENPYHVPVGTVEGKAAFAIISQLKLIDTKRLKNKIIVLDKATFETIRKAVKAML